MTLKINEVEVKHHLLAFEMRVVRGQYYPTPIKGYKNVLQKYWFLCMNDNYNDFHKSKENAHVFIYTKTIFFAKTFLYPLIGVG